MTDTTLLQRITARPDVFGGKPIIRDLRLSVALILSLLAQGVTPEAAREKIGMVVEGAYTCVSALQLSKQLSIPMPITEMVHKIIFENLKPQDAVASLMQRTIKEEHL